MIPLQVHSAAELEGLEAAIFPEDCLNQLALRVELERGFGWMEVDGLDATGYVLARRDGDLVDILRLGVLPHARGQGLGRRLLETVLVEAPRAMLTVKKWNVPAMKLYRSAGFKVVGDLASHMSWVMLRTSSK